MRSTRRDGDWAVWRRVACPPSAEQPLSRGHPSCGLGPELPSRRGAGRPQARSGCKGCVLGWDPQGASPEKPECGLESAWGACSEERCRQQRRQHHGLAGLSRGEVTAWTHPTPLRDVASHWKHSHTARETPKNLFSAVI